MVMRVNVKVFLWATCKYLRFVAIINFSFSLLILRNVKYSIGIEDAKKNNNNKKIQRKKMMRISINRTEHNGLL